VYQRRKTELTKRGVRGDLAYSAARSAKGPWRPSHTPALRMALSSDYVDSQGLLRDHGHIPLFVNPTFCYIAAHQGYPLRADRMRSFPQWNELEGPIVSGECGDLVHCASVGKNLDPRDDTVAFAGRG
jgi:hypothetical protein